MSTRDDNDMTPEERELARRLARIAPQGEPSAALDARILAAAHAAAAAPEPIRPRRAHRRKAARWPAVFGVAASLALACGIAWQLRPVPEAPVAAQSRAEADDAVEYAPRPPSVRMLPPKQLKVPEAPPAEPARSANAVRPRAAIRPANEEDRAEKPQAFAREADILLDEAVPAHAEVGAAAATAAPAAPPAPSPAAQAMRAKSSAEAAASADTHAAQRAADNAEVARDAAAFGSEPAYAEPEAEDIPPATADDPDVRAAWLRNIRALVRAGDLEAARESLRTYRERYPRQPIPDDLRALGE